MKQVNVVKAAPENTLTVNEVARRFHELAQAEKWFEIQDELFAEDVRSIEPPTATGLPNAQGKAAVRKKGETLLSQVEAVHRAFTSAPVVAGTVGVPRLINSTVSRSSRRCFSRTASTTSSRTR